MKVNIKVMRVKSYFERKRGHFEISWNVCFNSFRDINLKAFALGIETKGRSKQVEGRWLSVSWAEVSKLLDKASHELRPGKWIVIIHLISGRNWDSSASTVRVSLHKMGFQNLLLLLRIMKAKYVKILKYKCCFCGRCCERPPNAEAEATFQLPRKAFV